MIVSGMNIVMVSAARSTKHKTVGTIFFLSRGLLYYFLGFLSNGICLFEQ